MLIIALVLALIGLAALVFAVVTSNELVAWVCVGASVLGVVLLIVDAVRERQRRGDDQVEAHEDAQLDDELDEDEDDIDNAGEGAEAPVDYPDDISDDSGKK